MTPDDDKVKTVVVTDEGCSGCLVVTGSIIVAVAVGGWLGFGIACVVLGVMGIASQAIKSRSKSSPP